MGNTLSDWTGVTLNISSTNDYNSVVYTDGITLSQISMTNSIKTGGNSSINDSARDNSTFQGTMTFYYGVSGSETAPPTTATVKIQRLIERDEQTETDGTIERIETGRSLKGTYYQKDGTGINFTVSLQGAMNSLAAAAGLAIASSACLLAF